MAMERVVAHRRVKHKHAVCDGGVAMHKMPAPGHEQDIEQALFCLPRAAVVT
jgi:hypothetical protein